jgi:2-keto-3-deoxy-L-rhamnonate aldolase RhmA
VVAACRFPPVGERGFGPRRASGYGGYPAGDFCERANRTVLVFAQVEHPDAVKELTEIVHIEGLDGIVIGPNDLANSMGHIANPMHPEVRTTIERIITETREAGLMSGIGQGIDLEMARIWIDAGVQWLQLGCDYEYLRHAAQSLREPLGVD